HHGEADDVGEQDGDHPPLVAAEPEVGAAARAEPSAVGHGRAAGRAGHGASVWTATSPAGGVQACDDPAMEVQPKQPSARGPAALFPGEVGTDGVAGGQAPSRLSVSAVHFTPGARTAWHAHSLGQTLYVTGGEGLIQSRGEPIVTIHPGD